MPTNEGKAIQKMVKWLIGMVKAEPKDAVKEMDPLDWSVYRFLYRVSVYEHRTATLREVVDATQLDLTLPDDLKLQWNEADRDHCRKVWTIVQHINNSHQVEKQVFIKNYTYGLASKKDSDDYIRKLCFEGGSRLARAFRLFTRGMNDGQGKLLSCEGVQMDDSEGRDYVEAFIDWLLVQPMPKGKESKNGKRSKDQSAGVEGVHVGKENAPSENSAAS